MAKPFIPYSPTDGVPDTVMYHGNLIKLDPIAMVTHYLPVLLTIVVIRIPPTGVTPPLTKIEKTAMMFGMMNYFNPGT